MPRAVYSLPRLGAGCMNCIMSRIHLALVSVLAAPLLVSACGFRSDLDPSALGGTPSTQDGSLPQDRTTTPLQPDGTVVAPDSTVGPSDSTVTLPDSTTVVVPDAFAAPDSDVPGDASVPFDGPMPNGVQCDAVRCAVGELCCVSADSMGGATGVCSATSCPTSSDAGPVVSIGCDGPEDCASSGNVCCVNVALGAGRFPACSVGSASSACKAQATCPYAIPFSCNASVSSQACTTSSDCTGAAPKCCDLGALGIDSRLCTDTTIASFLGGACN